MAIGSCPYPDGGFDTTTSPAELANVLKTQTAQHESCMAKPF